MNEPKHMGKIWSLTLVLMGKIALITVPIAVLSLSAGRKLDARFGTAPWLMILLGIAGAGLIAFGVSKAARASAEALKALTRPVERPVERKEDCA